MVNLVARLLEELPLVAGGEEIAGMPPTLRYQRHHTVTVTSALYIKRLQCGEKSHRNLLRFLMQRGHHRKSSGIEITMKDRASTGYCIF